MMELSSIGEQALREFQWILHGFPLIPIVIGLLAARSQQPQCAGTRSRKS